ncbi:MAG: YitT family protein [Prevotellaceae bacterium]|nr:YitT family protein [Prevotellaceae bacterium]
MRKLHLKKEDVWTIVQDMVLINLGMAVYDIGWAAFLLPYHITTGGLAGLSAIIQYASGFPMQYTIFAVNLILLLLAWWILGLKFAVKTLYAVIFLTTYLAVGQDLMSDGQGGFLQVLGPGQDGMACMLGAVLNGIGIALVFLSGGSTGGWDILAAITNKYRNISLGRVLLYLDFIVIGSCWFVFNDWRMVVFGFVTLVIYTFTVDMVMNSTKQDIQLTIYTKLHVEIGDEVRRKTGHTLTLLYGEGGYSHTQMKVVVVIVHKREAIKVLRIVRSIDPDAFVTQHRVEGAFGKGFNAIKG